MKIAIYSKPFYPSVGGVEITTRSMAATLVELGHEVTVLTSTEIDEYPELHEGYHIVRSTTLPTLGLQYRQADMVISKGGVSIVSSLGCILARCPLVFVHEMSGSYLDKAGGLYKKIKNCIRKFACRYASLHIGVTNACLESKLLPSDVAKRVIYNFVDAKHFYENSSDNVEQNLIATYDVLFVGRITDPKGVFVLVAALKRFEDAEHRLSVAFVGRGKEEEKIKKLVSPWRYVDVTFKGALSGTELAGAYKFSKMVVVPSTTHPEGMGLVIAEALSFGRPVIGSDQPAIRETVGDGGVIFRNADDGDLYEKVIWLLDNKDVYRKLSAKARERAITFSAEAYKAQIADAIQLATGIAR